MKVIQSSNDIKECFEEIKQHLAANKNVVKGSKETQIVLEISREAYDLRSMNLTYNKKIEFAFQCDSNSITHLFQVA